MAAIQHHIEESELKELGRFLKRLEKDPSEQGIVRIIKALRTNHEVLTETWKDEKENVWTRPTPWAYAHACKQRDKYQGMLKIVEQKLMALGKFTHEQLKVAFENVQDATDWKNPIDKIIDDPGAENLVCLREAVIYFTGSVPTITKAGEGKVHVKANGYYLTIGA
jgi:hypothetical protein